MKSGGTCGDESSKSNEFDCRVCGVSSYRLKDFQTHNRDKKHKEKGALSR